MASRKQSGGALIVGILVLIALVPKEVWITLGVVTLVGGVFYVYSRWQSNKVPAPAAATDHQPTLAELTQTPPRRKPLPSTVTAPPAPDGGDMGPRPIERGTKASGRTTEGKTVGDAASSTRQLVQPDVAPDATSPPKIDLGNLAAAMNAVTERQSQSARADREAMPSIAPAKDTLGKLAVAMKAVAERKASSAVASSGSSGNEDPLIIVPSFTRPRPKEDHQTSTASETTKSQTLPVTGTPAVPMPPPLPAAPPQAVMASAAPGQGASHDELHRIATPSEEQRKFTVPRPPEGWATTRWLGPEDSIEIAGLTIRGGLFYTGVKLPTKYGGNDPSLVNAVLAVAPTGNFRVQTVGHRLSYAEFSPMERRAYLSWLASDRTDPECSYGCVHLFFYGIERRVLLDGVTDVGSKKDWPAIKSALRQLDAIYGRAYGSLRVSINSLLDWMELDAATEKLYLQPLPSFERSIDVPFTIRLALGQCSVDRAPIPGPLALAWARLNPAISIRTAATRCETEFDRLFLERYRELFGPGLVLTKNKTKLKFARQATSPGLYGTPPVTKSFDDIPDVTALRAPLNTLTSIVNQCAQELGAFSRLIGKTPEARDTLDGLLLLPPSIWPDTPRIALAKLYADIGEATITLPLSDVLDRLGGLSGALGREKVRDLARALESAHIGIEPNILEGARTPGIDDDVVLFAMLPDQTHQADTDAYQAALLTLQLASTVAQSDGSFSTEEVAHLTAEIDAWSHLSAADHRRLRAHLVLLSVAPINLASLKKKLDPLGQNTKEAIAAAMANLAQVDGMVSPEEVRFLEKVYKTLGVEPKRVFSDVHAPTARRASAAPDGTGFRLDPERIATLQRDTAKVSALLANIFAEELPDPVAPPPGLTGIEEEPVETGLLGLDDAHSALLRLMLSRPTWTRAELQDTASDLELMLDGALEQINDASFDAYDLPFSEGDDPLEINPEFIEKIEQ